MDETQKLVLLFNENLMHLPAVIIKNKDIETTDHLYYFPVVETKDGDYVETAENVASHIIVCKYDIYSNSQHRMISSTEILETSKEVEINDLQTDKYDGYYYTIFSELVDKLKKELPTDKTHSFENNFKRQLTKYMDLYKDRFIMHFDFLYALNKIQNPLNYMYNTFKGFNAGDGYDMVICDGEIRVHYDIERIGEKAYIDLPKLERQGKLIDNDLESPYDGQTYFARKPSDYNYIVDITKSGIRDISPPTPYLIADTVVMPHDEFVKYTEQEMLRYDEEISSRKEDLSTYDNVWECIKFVDEDNPDKSILVHPSGYDYARYVALEEKQVKQLEKDILQQEKNRKSHER